MASTLQNPAIAKPAEEVSSNNDVKPEIKSDIKTEVKTETAPVTTDTKAVDVKLRLKLSEQAAARVDEIMKKIAAQVEFYLGDYNLSNDKFFRDLVEKEEGWVTLDNFMKCNRVKKFTSNADDVMTSVKKFSTKFDVDEAGKRIKRKEHFVMKDPTAMQADRLERTVHVKRFPKSATVDTIHTYFSQFGPVDGFVQNKFQDGDAKTKGKFNGSVDCIYVNKSDAEAYLANSEEKVKFDGKEMRREWKKQHDEDKIKRTVDKKAEIEASKISGSVLHISSHRNIDYLPVREYFEKQAPVRFLDYQKGQKEGRVRFTAGVAKEVLDKILAANNNKVIIDGKQFKAKVLDEKEEGRYFATYWDTYVEAKNNRVVRDMRNDSRNQFRFNPPSRSVVVESNNDKKSANSDVKTENDSENKATNLGKVEPKDEMTSPEKLIKAEPTGQKRPLEASESETKRPKLEDVKNGATV